MLFVADYDLVHAHNLDVGLFTYFLRFKYKNKIMGTFHGNPYESAKWGKFARWYLKFSEKLFIKSCKILTTVSPTKAVEGKKVAFIPNGMEKIKLDSFKTYINESINYKELNIQKNKYLLFVAGRLDKRKGLHHLLNAYADDAIDHQLVIISDFKHDKAYTESIERRLYELRNKNIVVIKELLAKKDLFDVIINAKLVVFPSEIEAMSMFMLEVLACNKTIVCSDIEANTQVLGKEYEYLFNNAKAGSLATSVQIAIRDIDTDNMGNYTIKRHQTKLRYDWKRIVGQYSDLYNSFFLKID